MEEYKILAMNFGSTSTKVAAYEGDTQLLQKVFHHSPEDLQGVSSMEDNAALRKPLILNYLKEQGVDLKEFDAIVGRGWPGAAPSGRHLCRQRKDAGGSAQLHLRHPCMQPGWHPGCGNWPGAG